MSQGLPSGERGSATNYNDVSWRLGTRNQQGDLSTDKEALLDGAATNDGLGTQNVYKFAAEHTMVGPSRGSTSTGRSSVLADRDLDDGLKERSNGDECEPPYGRSRFGLLR